MYKLLIFFLFFITLFFFLLMSCTISISLNSVCYNDIRCSTCWSIILADFFFFYSMNLCFTIILSIFLLVLLLLSSLIKLRFPDVYRRCNSIDDHQLSSNNNNNNKEISGLYIYLYKIHKNT